MVREAAKNSNYGFAEKLKQINKENQIKR